VFRKSWLLVMLLGITILFSACGQQTAKHTASSRPLLSNSLSIAATPTTAPIQITIKRQEMTPTSTPTPKPTPTAVPTTPPSAPAQANPPTDIPNTGTGAAPYGPPPAMSAEEVQLTQQLFALINSDRAIRGLPAYSWNATLAGGARLHSWNMYHCGFSHTCPDGLSQCQRIANEGFAGYTDCGECIGWAGPFPTAYDGMHSVQESMVNEPPTGWHRIHLLSTTLHRGGVGIYVDSTGYMWFTEDFVS
jgi:uncharacterized protein YkwD